jgi:hypothetical protein
MSAGIVAAFRKLPSPPKESFTRELMALGEELTLAKRPSEAEPHLREALQIWTGHAPDAWQATVAKWQLARALLRQQKHAEAEPLLLEAYKETVERIERAPPWQKDYPATTANLLIELYKATNKPDELKKWQAERAKHNTPAPNPAGKQ